MPKSRRDRPVSLTKTKKRPRILKDRLLSSVRSAVSVYRCVYVFEVRHMRNVAFKAVRDEWGGSRFFLGKTRVMQAALGHGREDEAREGLSALTPYVTGSRGLLFTDAPRAEVVQYFSHFSSPHFARSGCVAPRAFEVEKGPLDAEVAPHSMEPHLRKLGLPTRLKDGVVEVERDVVVCREGDVLTPEQCRLLQTFGVRMAHMTVDVLAGWDGDTGKVEELREGVSREEGVARVQTGRRRGGRGENDRGEEGQEEAQEDGVGEDEEDEDAEFVPEPMEGWGEVAVPAYAQ